MAPIFFIPECPHRCLAGSSNISSGQPLSPAACSSCMVPVTIVTTAMIAELAPAKNQSNAEIWRRFHCSKRIKKNESSWCGTAPAIQTTLQSSITRMPAATMAQNLLLGTPELLFLLAVSFNPASLPRLPLQTSCGDYCNEMSLK